MKSTKTRKKCHVHVVPAKRQWTVAWHEKQKEKMKLLQGSTKK